jgi:hypothetical protein
MGVVKDLVGGSGALGARGALRARGVLTNGRVLRTRSASISRGGTAKVIKSHRRVATDARGAASNGSTRGASPDSTGLINIARLIGKRTLPIQSTALASDQLPCLFLGHVLVVVVVVVVASVPVAAAAAVIVVAVAGRGSIVVSEGDVRNNGYVENMLAKSSTETESITGVLFGKMV